jgi:hypothetical protein
MNNQDERPTVPTSEEAAEVGAKMRQAIAEFRRKALVEKRITTEDFVSFFDSITEFCKENDRILERFGTVVQYAVNENRKLREQITSLISGRPTETD